MKESVKNKEIIRLGKSWQYSCYNDIDTVAELQLYEDEYKKQGMIYVYPPNYIKDEKAPKNKWLTYIAISINWNEYYTLWLTTDTCPTNKLIQNYTKSKIKKQQNKSIKLKIPPLIENKILH